MLVILHNWRLTNRRLCMLACDLACRVSSRLYSLASSSAAHRSPLPAAAARQHLAVSCTPLQSTTVPTAKMVHHVKNKNDLDGKLTEAGEGLVVIDFFATWCGPCKIIAPKLEELSQEYPDVLFLKVDVDECEDLATEYNISAMPTFVFLKGKNKVDSFSGASYDKLKEKVDQLK